MKPRKRYYSTTGNHEVGVDVWIHSPDTRHMAFLQGRYDSGDAHVERAKADAKLIVDALNAYAKRQQHKQHTNGKE